MDSMRASEMRQRITTMLDEMGGMLSMVPRLLDENAGLKAAGDAAAREIEALRGEVASMKADLQHLVGERSEFQQVFTQTMNEIIDLMNQVVPRLQGAATRRSPFEREGANAEPAAHAGVVAATPPAWRA